jgi:hypothetical protein
LYPFWQLKFVGVVYGLLPNVRSSKKGSRLDKEELDGSSVAAEAMGRVIALLENRAMDPSYSIGP